MAFPKIKVCEYCAGARKDIKIENCANGDYWLEGKIMKGSIVLFQVGLALGYFDINYCPECGKKQKEG